ncbi:MAG: Trk family potassium uptake protein [Oscillospiraceae bacterium]|nr:Trk family potassium uptake protein [Oscillospiraceae bacterium]
MKLRFSHVQIIVAGFLSIVLLGTVLLLLPVSSADGAPAPFRTALFTAVSASCVTGLVLRDTATGWSGFGQAVLLVLIQLGGLGFMTIATFLYQAFHRRMGLRSRELMVESINTTHVGGIMRLARQIVLLTAAFEGAGALLLLLRFGPRFGFWRGLWYSVFHSVSAFCNAGFDLMGVLEPGSSLTHFSGDFIVNITLVLLITLGGLGFLVWDDLLNCGRHFKRYRLHTKLVLVTSAVLTLGGAVLFLIMEWNATGADLKAGERVLTALFAAVTPRTAGFNTVNIPDMSSASKLLTIFLMIVGGSPGSTAGGVKTTSLAVILLYTFASFRGREKPTVFGRSISEETFRKSCSVLFFNIGIAILAAIVLCAWQPLDPIDALFETVSAIGTVGMTAGITQSLRGFSAYVIALLMFAGRVGSVSFAVALLSKRSDPPVTYPVEEITVG